MDKFKDVDNEALAALLAEKMGDLTPMLAIESPTVDQVAEANALAAEVREIQTETAERETAAAEAGEAFAALQAEFTEQPAEEVEEAEVVEEEPEEEVTEEPAPEEPAEPAKATARGSNVATLAKKSKRPAVVSNERKPVTITAAADVPEYSTGQALGGLEDVARAVINRSRGFAAPQGDGTSEDLRQFGTAMFRMDFDEDLVVDRMEDAQDVFHRASQESRLPGGSLVAAGGWCAPSETVYDLSIDATTEGMLSLPEVAVRRGGIRYAQSPDFSVFYSNPGFKQTEAQAIAGTTKPCVEVPCPSFTDVRLDAIGICIRVPILTNAAYPEVVANFVSGTMIAHQHWVNADVIGRLVTFAGTARDATQEGLGTTAGDTLAILELLADQRRQQYRLGMNQSLEVVVPFWVKGAIRNDLSMRTGQQGPVTDQQIMQHFAVRNLNVQFVYDWQLLPTVDVGGTAGVDESMTYPASFQALMYPAGTFVKGTSDVINLNTVYDAASLATNVYTGLFAEEGILVAKMKFAADLITIPIASAGRTGAHDIVTTAAGWA